jgi:hypothetical protein
MPPPASASRIGAFMGRSFGEAFASCIVTDQASMPRTLHSRERGCGPAQLALVQAGHKNRRVLSASESPQDHPTARLTHGAVSPMEGAA